MPYDEYTIRKAKEKGIFEDNVFDPKVLLLPEEDKEKIQKQLNKLLDETEKKETKLKNIPPQKEVDVELNFMEKLIAFILSFFGIMTLSDYKIRKALHIVEKKLSKIKPQVYNHSSKKLTRFFALKIYNLYTQLGLLRDLIQYTFNSPEWSNPLQPGKTGIELLFEKLCNINSSVTDEKFSIKNITKVVTEMGSLKLAWAPIEDAIKNHLESFTSDLIKNANMLYTNLLYLKRIAEYDFIQLLKRFDPNFSPKETPIFTDIPGEAIIPYLIDLEENLIQIDFSLDNLTLLKKLTEVAKFLSISPQAEGGDVTDELLEEEILNLINNLNNLASERVLTMLIQVLKKDPFYFPSVFYVQYDLFKIYSEVFYKRIKFITESIVKEKKLKEMETFIKKDFNEIVWAGVYCPEYSEKIERKGLGNFDFTYHIGTIRTFFDLYFKDSIRDFLSLVLLNGLFADRFFQKTLSELTYNLEKFEEKFRNFLEDVEFSGNSGKKITGYLERTDLTPEIKKTAERVVSNINANAKELFNEFYNIFIILEDCISKLRKDIELHPPKYLRNIRSIGGSKNQKLLSALIIDSDKLKSLKEVFVFLRE